MSRLDTLAIRNPCSADWAAMDGTDTRRFCLQCNKAVHNLSAMSPCEAEALLAQPGPVPCVRFLRRRDGSIIHNMLRAAAMAGLAACARHAPPEPMMGDIAYDPETPEQTVETPPAPTDPTGPTDPTIPVAIPAPTDPAYTDPAELIPPDAEPEMGKRVYVPEKDE